MAFALDSFGILRVPEWLNLPWLLHGFTTSAAGDFSRGRGNGARIAGAIDAAGMDVRTLRQIHSNRLVAINGDPDSLWNGDDPEADGLITSRPGEVVAVRTADCVPILLLDRRERVAAAVHAGWRGSVARIAYRAVSVFTAEFGCHSQNLEAAIGPAIGPCCFETGEEVAAHFDSSFLRRRKKPYVDLIEANRRQLIEAGVSAEKIRSAAVCTFCSRARLYSFRRQGSQSGRMLAFAGIRRAPAD